MNSNIRTDLALEAHELARENLTSPGEIPGVQSKKETRGSFAVTTVEVLDERGEEAIGKPRGRYVTLELDGLFRREEDAFSRACSILAEELGKMAEFTFSGNYLVVGLGNRDITPDAIGPDTVDHIIVTRHLKELLPEDFAAFAPVTAICSGVLGTTGIESSEVVQALVKKLSPQVVIAVDALASREPSRLCRTVQLADTGIVPGSGVGNARKALNLNTLGIPVIAIGVPTVVDAATLAMDLAGRSGAVLDPEGFGDAGKMIVTPRNIDKDVRDISKLIGYSLNMALHKGLSLADIDMFLS